MRIYRALYAEKALANLCYQLGFLDDGEFQWKNAVTNLGKLEVMVRKDLSHFVGYVSIRNGTVEGNRRMAQEEFTRLKEMQIAHNNRHSKLLREAEEKKKAEEGERKKNESERMAEELSSWHTS